MVWMTLWPTETQAIKTTLDQVVAAGRARQARQARQARLTLLSKKASQHSSQAKVLFLMLTVRQEENVGKVSSPRVARVGE